MYQPGSLNVTVSLLPINVAPMSEVTTIAGKTGQFLLVVSHVHTLASFNIIVVIQ